MRKQRQAAPPRCAPAGVPGSANCCQARRNWVSELNPAVSAARLKMKQQAMTSALMKVGAAVDGGEMPAAEAKRLVLGRVVRGLGSVEAAEKWYRSHHIAELGGRTPAQLVRAGELKALLAQLNAAKA